uniref:C3H1-type domain-containing protein n=1 Tax=Panagrellus redivivus TaxID=6233 RepID=A0A7E4VPD1_PANRE
MNSTMPIKPVTEEIGTLRVQIPKPAYRTRMCHEYLEGFCSYGETCRYAHGADQLREAPRNEPWGKPKKSADFNPFFY